MNIFDNKIFMNAILIYYLSFINNLNYIISLKISNYLNLKYILSNNYAIFSWNLCVKKSIFSLYGFYKYYSINKISLCDLICALYYNSFGGILTTYKYIISIFLILNLRLTYFSKEDFFWLYNFINKILLKLYKPNFIVKASILPVKEVFINFIINFIYIKPLILGLNINLFIRMDFYLFKFKINNYLTNIFFYRLLKVEYYDLKQPVFYKWICLYLYNNTSIFFKKYKQKFLLISRNSIIYNKYKFNLTFIFYKILYKYWTIFLFNSIKNQSIFLFNVWITHVKYSFKAININYPGEYTDIINIYRLHKIFIFNKDYISLKFVHSIEPYNSKYFNFKIYIYIRKSYIKYLLMLKYCFKYYLALSKVCCLLAYIGYIKLLLNANFKPKYILKLIKKSYKILIATFLKLKEILIYKFFYFDTIRSLTLILILLKISFKLTLIYKNCSYLKFKYGFYLYCVKYYNIITVINIYGGFKNFRYKYFLHKYKYNLVFLLDGI